MRRTTAARHGPESEASKSGRATTALAALVLGAGALLASVGPVEAQVHLGPQLSWADDADLGLGGRVVAGLPDYRGFEGVGSFDLFFPDGDADYWEINANGVYNFTIAEAPVLRPYAGAGLNIARFDRPDDGLADDDTEVGLNLLVGNKFDLGNLTPYAELRVEAEGGEQIVLTGGLLFP